MPTAPLHVRAPRVALPLAAALLAASALALPVAAQRPSSTILVSMPGAPAGTEVTVRISGLTPELPLQIGFGGLQTNQEVLATGVADSSGNYELVTKIPAWVERHRTYRFFLAYANQPPRTVSDPFIATAAEGFVRVAGSVSAVSPGCVQVRGFDETLYTLLGDAGELQTGARVVVEGTVGVLGEGQEPAPKGCGPGGTIPVRVRQVLPC